VGWLPGFVFTKVVRMGRSEGKETNGPRSGRSVGSPALGRPARIPARWRGSSNRLADAPPAGADRRLPAREMLGDERRDDAGGRSDEHEVEGNGEKGVLHDQDIRSKYGPTLVARMFYVNTFVLKSSTGDAFPVRTAPRRVAAERVYCGRAGRGRPVAHRRRNSGCWRRFIVAR
jgi:hypothetical protein